MLEKHLLPFIANTFPDGHRFMQDNDPKHTTRIAKKYYQEKGINWRQTPQESPDMNPNELIWNELIHFLRTTVEQNTKDELLKDIQSFWQTRITVEKCNNYINHLEIFKLKWLCLL